MTVSAIALGVPAFAGSIEQPVDDSVFVPAPPPEEPMRADGDWTGFYGGAQLGYGDVTTDGAADLDGDDVIGGLIAGYDYDFGQFVLGGGIDYDIASIELDDADTLESVLRLKARGGYDLGNGLLYATGGWAQATADELDSSDGYFLGAGYEHRVTQNISLGGEALFHQFDDFDDSDIDIDATTLQARLSYRF
ncbi:porin family protein [Sulfitobacter sp. 1151]|uniref:Porin family protein n=2 Tax=Parasulfitobacter algicola TaxID=2614809 RepID=A0ABX2IRD1_9RHOB|nr:porin family protein [Sulfitobacter algicola]